MTKKINRLKKIRCWPHFQNRTLRLWAHCLPKPDNTWCKRRSVGSILVGKSGFYSIWQSNFSSEWTQWASIIIQKMSNALFIWLKCRVQLKWGRQRRVWLMPAKNTVFSVIFFKYRPCTPLICCSLKRAQRICLLLIPPSLWKRSSKKKKEEEHTPVTGLQGSVWFFSWLWYMTDYKRSKF